MTEAQPIGLRSLLEIILSGKMPSWRRSVPFVPRRPRPPALSAPQTSLPGATEMPVAEVADQPVQPKSRIRPKLITPRPVDETPVPAATPEDPPVRKGRGHPPAQHQFKKGNKGGPGRPKGSKNHATLMKERFETKRPLRINGVERLATQHEILIDIRFKQALEGKEKAMAHLFSEAARLFPSNDDSGHVSAVSLPVSRAEQAILDQILSTMGLAPMLGGDLPLTTGTLEEFLGDPDDEEAERAV